MAKDELKYESFILYDDGTHPNNAGLPIVFFHRAFCPTVAQKRYGSLGTVFGDHSFKPAIYGSNFHGCSLIKRVRNPNTDPSGTIFALSNQQRR